MNKFKNVKNSVLFTLVTLFSVQSFAAYNDMHKAVDDNNSKEIERLLTKSPTMLQEFDDNGNTPIHKAIMENKNSSLQTFMKFKRAINTQINNRTGETPLVFAIKNKKYNSIIFMLDNGINPFYKDRANKNSLDYVKEFGDITTKQIYNEFYARNRDKIKRLQESYNEPVDLSLWKGEEKKIVEKKSTSTPKVSTVQDLLIGNSKNKKLTTPVVSVVETPTPIVVESKEESKIGDDVPADKVKELSDKIEKYKTDQASVNAMQEKIAALESQNDYLKRKIEIKAVTGKDDLTPEEENVAKSQYAGIYEQQLIYGDITTDEAGIPNFDDVKVVSQNSDDTLPVIGDVIDYKSGAVKTLNNIEQEFPTLSYNINTAIKNDVKVEQVVLPIDKLPESQVVVNVPDAKDSIQVDTQVENDKPTLNSAVKSVEVSPLKNMTTSDIEKPALTIVKTKENLKQEFSNKMSSDNSVMLILGLISLGFICFISYGVVSYMDYKKRKIAKSKIVPTNQKEKSKNKDISIEVTDKDKI
jgi:ankyrin repeat protein